MKPDLLPHDADAWLQSCSAPLFPTTVYPTAEQLAERHKLQRKHLSDTRRIFGGTADATSAVTDDDIEDVDCDDESAFAGLRWAMTWFLRWLAIVLIACVCAGIGVAASIWAIAP